MIPARYFLTLLVCLLASSGLRAESPAPLPVFTPWDVKALNKVPAMEWLDRPGDVRALFYDGEPYQGRKTKVFAYYASPVTLGLEKAEPARKYPAVVLVHGGGGQAFDQWVRVYAKRGYAAIAMDLAGNWAPDGKSKSERHPDGGPPQDDATKLRLPDAPDRDQWTYHAVADALLAHSLLRSFPEVDAERTGVIGISWGGYLTCIVAGLDARFKAACPVYGCGFLSENSYWLAPQFDQMTPDWREKWVRLWDPKSYVGSAAMPMLFTNDANDFAYPLDSYMKTYRFVQSPKNIRIEPGGKHGYFFEIQECLLFFDSILKDGAPLPRVTRVSADGGKLVAEVDSRTALKKAELRFTTGPHRENKTRPWTAAPLTIEGYIIRGEAPPAEATAWFITVTDERDALVSSDVTIR